MSISSLPHARLVMVYEDLEQLSSAVARRIAEAAQLAIAARGVFKLTLAGGETPRCCYEKLRHLGMDWNRVQIYFGDERCLPNGDLQRNDSMAQKALLDHVAIPAGNVHSIPAEQGARRAAEHYAATLGSGAPLDLVLLGMGEDGHTASLFPNNPAAESTASVVAVFNAPKPPAERVSLGIKTLNEARQKMFLIAGATKHAALEQMLLGINLPAARVTSAEWYLDNAAVAQ